MTESFWKPMTMKEFIEHSLKYYFPVMFAIGAILHFRTGQYIASFEYVLLFVIVRRFVNKKYGLLK